MQKGKQPMPPHSCLMPDVLENLGHVLNSLHQVGDAMVVDPTSLEEHCASSVMHIAVGLLLFETRDCEISAPLFLHILLLLPCKEAECASAVCSSLLAAAPWVLSASWTINIGSDVSRVCTSTSPGWNLTT